MSKRFGTVFSGVLLQLLLVVVPGTALAQDAPPPPIRAANPEVVEVVRNFYEYEREVPLRAEVIARQEFPAYTREKIVFSGTQRSRVPGYLALPKGGTGPFPVVLLIDGITGSKERWFQEDSWPRGTLVTDRLIAEGIAVLALDARYHGERAAENDYRLPTELAGLRDMVAQSVVEHRRALDYLATRSEVDTTRIGSLGLSMGGLITFALAGVDPRIRAGVAGVTPVGGGTRQPIAVPVAPQTFAAAIRQTPMLMIMGRSDPFYSVQEAEQLFGLIGSQRKELILYDGDHRPPPEYATQSADWLVRYLRNQ
jgi:dienelactone hydrolase